MLGVAGALVLLTLDGALIGLLNVAPPAALTLALLGVGGVYLPARAALDRRLRGRATLSSVQLLQSATEIALAPRAEERRAQWRKLLERMFQPLELGVAGRDPGSPHTSGDALLLPATAGEGPLRLRHRDGGRRLFSNEDLALAGELVRLVGWAEAARDTYARGAAEERTRIARDLHDDVSAILLTSLHRDDLSEAKKDVRKAMAEMRAAVSALDGESVKASQLLADMRFETSERLTTSGVTLDWPLLASTWADSQLSADQARALISSHRELVSNIVRHSGASKVVVRIELTGEALEMVVEDDGCGLPSTLVEGSGIANIAYRLGRAGGEATFCSSFNGLRVVLKLHREPVFISAADR